MRKLLIATLLLNFVCLLVICQPLPVLAGSGSGGGPVDACEGDPTKYALDTNGDNVVDLSDFVAGLSWFFSGGTAPRVCLDTTDLEANLEQAEAALGTAQEERDAAQTALVTANGQVTELTGQVATLTEDLAAAEAAGVNLSDPNLSGLDLSGIDLSNANLSNANLSNTNLSGVNLFGADLTGACLSGARVGFYFPPPSASCSCFPVLCRKAAGAFLVVQT